MVNTNNGVNPLNHPMVKKEVDKEEAIDNFIAFLEQDDYADSYTTKLANTLKDIAVKYKELADDGTSSAWTWHEYFEMALDKFIMDLPKTPADLHRAVRKLTEMDVVFEAACRGVDVQIVPKYRDQSASTSTDAQESSGGDMDNVNALAKRLAEYLLADGKSTSDAEGRPGPSKRIKVEGENATIFKLEDDDTPCTVLVFSGDGTTSKLDLIVEGTGPAILTVKVHKKDVAVKTFML